MPSAAAVPAPPPPAVPATAPAFSVGGVIGKTFSTWSKNLVPFAVFAGIVNAPLFAIGLWNNYAVYGGYPSFQQVLEAAQSGRAAQGPLAPWTLPWAAIQLLVVFLMLVQMGAFTFGAIQHLAGRTFSFGTLLGAGVRRAWPVFLAGFVSAVLIGFASLLLVVPGIIVACAACAAVPAVVAEGKGPVEAVKRSFALTKGRRLAIFAAFLVMGLVTWTASAVVGLLPFVLGGGIASLAAGLFAFVAGAVVTPLTTIVPGVVYHDLRVSKEGVATAELAKVFE